MGRFYVAQRFQKWTSMEAEVMGIKTAFKRPESNSLGFLEVFESLEDLQREYPGGSHFVVAEVPIPEPSEVEGVVE